MNKNKRYWLQATSCIGEKDYLSAIALCDKALLYDSCDLSAVILTTKGRALTLLMKYDEAIITYTKAINSTKKNPRTKCVLWTRTSLATEI